MPADGLTNEANRQRRPRRRVRETADIVAMVLRMVRAIGRRVADGDEYDLAGLVAIRQALDDVTADVVDTLHYDQKFPWSAIGEITGTTRQNAQQRWGRTPARRKVNR